MGDFERKIAKRLGISEKDLLNPSSVSDGAGKEAKSTMPYYCNNCRVPVGENDVYRYDPWYPGPQQTVKIFHKKCDNEVVINTPTA